VSQGTMTSDSSEPTRAKPFAHRPIQQIPLADHPARSSSLNQNSARTQKPDTSQSGSRLASLLRMDAYRSQLADDFEPRSPTSSRPSLEGGRPSARDLGSGVHRSQSLNMRNRPVSVNIGAGPTHIKDREIKPLDYETTFTSAEPEMPALTQSESATNITSDVDFLKAREEEEKERKQHHRRLGSGPRHVKRASLPSIGIAGTTKLIAGKFGDAFKMFENNDSNHHHHHHHRQRSDSPSEEPINVLTPIAGSEATDISDDRQPFDETEDLSPEMRRELEKRKLEAEERRVANAAAEYRQRVAARGGGNAGQGKAASIQNRVHSLLGDSDRPAQKTATGYGRYTASPAPQEGLGEGPPGSPYKVPSGQASARHEGALHHSASAPTSVVDLSRTTSRTQRPMAPPKPKVLRSTVGDANSIRANEETAVGPVDEDWESSFSKKYPSLAGLEMVETSLTGPKSTTSVRTKEV